MFSFGALSSCVGGAGRLLWSSCTGQKHATRSAELSFRSGPVAAKLCRALHLSWSYLLL
jgi:hypothetical protein